jgi:GcrA cell cycle regulator
MSPSPDKRWTEERCDELRRLVAEGNSYALIAGAMGISRNAAIGKALRLGLCHPVPVITKARQEPWQPRHRPPSKRGEDGGLASRLSHRRAHNFTGAKIAHRKTVEDPGMEQTADVFDQAIPLAQRRSLMELDADTCRWPVGEGADLFFCGATPTEGFSYCGPHCRRAYAGAPDGTRRRPFIAMRTRAA